MIIVILVFGLTPHYQAEASIFDLGSIANEAIEDIASWFITKILEFAGTAIAFFASILDAFIGATGYNIPVVNIMWSLMKNFVNLFFILILVIMAFATIFDLKKYSIQSLLVRLVVVALLINFSLLIGQTVISTGDFVTHVFLEQIENTNPGGIGVNAMKGLDLQDMIGTRGDQITDNLASKVSEVLITGIFAIIFIIVALFVFIVVALFVLIRIPVLWFLLILSPIAWLGLILPGTQGWWKDWWKHFISWVFFPPVYVFFLMFGVGFINTKAQFANLGINIAANQLDSFFNISNIFYYLVTLIFLGGGIFMAKKVSFLAGTGAVKAAGWSENLLKRAPIFGRGQSYASLKKGAQGTLGTIKEQGIPGTPFKGEQGFRKASSAAQDRMQRALGFKPSYAGQKEFITGANKEYEALKQQYDLGQINIAAIQARARSTTADTVEGFAHRKLLGELGQLDDAMLGETLNATSDNPYAAVDFIKNSSAKGKLSAVSPAAIRQMAAAEGAYTGLTTAVAARRELYRHIQGNPKLIADLTATQFNEGIDIFGGATTADGSAFLKEAAKVRPDYVADYNTAHPRPGAPVLSRDRHIAASINNAQDVASMPVVVWGDIDFQRALYDEVRARAAGRPRSQYITNLNEEVRKSAGSVADKTTKQASIATLGNPATPRP